jgi:hypothetical protein
MRETSTPAAIKKLMLTSPWFLLIFLVIPFYIVVGIKLHLHVSGDLLLANNACFLLLVAVRLIWYALRLGRDIRYGADYRPPRNLDTLVRPIETKPELAAAGYRFDAQGSYGEKRDLGFPGTTLLYAGLLLLLFFGTYDYLREYSIMVRTGVGEPMPLDGKGLAGQFEAGGLAATSSLPQLQVKSQILPNAQWPQGATEIALIDKDHKELATGTIAPGKPFRYGGLDFHMIRFIFDTLIVIREGKSIVYESFVKLLPLPVKKGEFSYFGGLANKDSGAVKGGAWLNPEKRSVLVEATLDGKKLVDTQLELWGENKKVQGKYLASLEGIAQWSEIRVARGRHRSMLMIGAALALLGVVMRLVFRPKRVWLNERSATRDN